MIVTDETTFPISREDRRIITLLRPYLKPRPLPWKGGPHFRELRDGGWLNIIPEMPSYNIPAMVAPSKKAAILLAEGRFAVSKANNNDPRYVGVLKSDSVELILSNRRWMPDGSL